MSETRHDVTALRFAAQRVVDYWPIWYADRENDAAEFHLRAGILGLARALAGDAATDETPRPRSPGVRVMAYADLLRDPRWQRKRLEIMQRDGFACRECEDASTALNVHHTYYAKGRKPWEYEDASLLTLCEPCHKELTDLLQLTNRVLGTFSLDDVARVLRAVMDIDSEAGVARSVPVASEPAAQKTYPSPDMCPACSMLDVGIISIPAWREEQHGGMTRAYYCCSRGHEWFTDWGSGMRLTAAQMIADMVELHKPLPAGDAVVERSGN